MMFCVNECMMIVCVCDGDMEPCTRTEPTTLSRGNPAQTGRHLGQGERSPSNKPYLQRVTEWTRHSRARARYRVYSTLSK